MAHWFISHTVYPQLKFTYLKGHSAEISGASSKHLKDWSSSNIIGSYPAFAAATFPANPLLLLYQVWTQGEAQGFLSGYHFLLSPVLGQHQPPN